MIISDFLKTQLRLLVAQFGRRSVLEALAGLTDASLPQIEEEIAKLAATRSAKSSKHPKSLDELLNSISTVDEPIKNLIAQLGRLFESKQFLPNLRDVEEFLRRRGVPEKKYKNRNFALVAVLKTLSEAPEKELESLISHYTASAGKSEYAILANQIMGKKDH